MVLPGDHVVDVCCGACAPVAVVVPCASFLIAGEDAFAEGGPVRREGLLAGAVLPSGHSFTPLVW